MTLVVDASIAAAWRIPDEQNEPANAVLRRLIEQFALVPALFWFEVRNLFLVAERRKRMPSGGAMLAMAMLRQLPLDDQHTDTDYQVLFLAAKHALSAYDASYLALAMDHRLPLATADRRLAAAARAEAIEILGPLSNPL